MVAEFCDRLQNLLDLYKGTGESKTKVHLIKYMHSECAMFILSNILYSLLIHFCCCTSVRVLQYLTYYVCSCVIDWEKAIVVCATKSHKNCDSVIAVYWKSEVCNGCLLMICSNILVFR